jgi:hypothetical protein
LLISHWALVGGLPAAGGAAVIAILSVRRRGLSLAQLLLGLASFGWLGLTFGTLAGWRSFERNAERRLTEAMSYCDGLRSKLESYHAAHGAYPNDLNAIDDTRERPLLVRTGDTTYRADGERFWLSINTSRGLCFVGARFDSATGAWTRLP